MPHSCPWCMSPRTRVSHKDCHHKVDASFGPFDLATCDDCGSLGTVNPPSPARLAEFYENYDKFRPAWYFAGASGGALDAQYRYYSRFLLSRMGAARTWLDLGAGHGEVAAKIRAAAPQCDGLAVDIGPRPADLPADLAYRQLDLNHGGWRAHLGTFDCVFSVAVWEHVLSPEAFAAETLGLVAAGGTLILITPDYGSLARKTLGRRWPYFEPGEHISLPTRKGAEACVHRAAGAARLKIRTETISLNVGYSLRYVLEVLRLTRLARLVPPGLSAPMPAGILATIVGVEGSVA